MNFAPLFSILIANYNNGQYLKEAIDSVFNQTYENWEIIILDDCSTDHSKEVYGLYEHNPRIKVYFNEFNSGVGYTKRRLCELAGGDLMGFLDSDDALESHALEKMVQAHVQNPVASLVCSRYYICDEQLKIIEPSIYCIPLPKGDSAINYPPSKIASHFAVFKKSAYMKTIGIDPKFKLSEDMDLYYKLEEHGQIHLLEEHLYFYRLHKRSISQNEKQFEAIIYNIQAKIDACQRRNIDSIALLHKAIPNFYQIHSSYLSSKEYQIGKFILAPIRKMLKIIGFYGEN